MRAVVEDELVDEFWDGRRVCLAADVGLFSNEGLGAELKKRLLVVKK